MRALIHPLLLGATGQACGLAAVGVALHGAAWPPALLYGGFGAAAGLACTLLQWAHHRLPVHEALPDDGPGEAPAAVLARAMLAQIARTRPPAAAAPAPASPAAAAPPPADAPATARAEPSTFGA
ncbi:hypothetical protein [Aquabacterium sp. OR-4]|uniref:hypothetical protein n=1 Tax=Aquabacterium sp. OR-4 TaxID=2978127 RepID=UPI0021B346C2|nr:hypothetical protein [Aquabacterium sp. OR-4]MDT7834924.1 hypothetical protein [Aquabacterium sp. OR-4]